jgi:hypothetical protein
LSFTVYSLGHAHVLEWATEDERPRVLCHRLRDDDLTTIGSYRWSLQAFVAKRPFNNRFVGVRHTFLSPCRGSTDGPRQDDVQHSSSSSVDRPETSGDYQSSMDLIFFSFQICNRTIRDFLSFASPGLARVALSRSWQGQQSDRPPTSSKRC